MTTAPQANNTRSAISMIGSLIQETTSGAMFRANVYLYQKISELTSSAVFAWVEYRIGVPSQCEHCSLCNLQLVELNQRFVVNLLTKLVAFCYLLDPNDRKICQEALFQSSLNYIKTYDRYGHLESLEVIFKRNPLTSRFQEFLTVWKVVPKNWSYSIVGMLWNS